ncbi:MAG: hypothetical protein HN704_11275 [Bacteroidetes bacterium]|nr:hypothetical protein [Bacteroidota bacterium]MBT6687135.1 hypothetical protein [Bacteroidota bacterium]MBT7144908.1 hypothetical protein [Bacteroidota bacterium]MBT7492173.1 hypothetical protein [Bacteroidota bacterium]
MKYNKDIYKIYTWKNLLMFHWIINPGLAINELILGQRVPKISLEDKTSDKPKVERTYVPCPHCEKFHDSRTWSLQNGTAFKNWFGLYCNNCGDIIPCLTNVLSFVILILTYPFWVWFKNDLKKKWLEKQDERYKNLDLESPLNPLKKRTWIISGLIWGLLMFITMTFIFPFFNGDSITLKKSLLSIPVWSIAGLGFGYSMKFFTTKKGKNTDTNKVL